MTTLDLGKTAASAANTAGAQARKRREIRFENPFTDFLERRGEGWGQVRQRKSATLASPLEQIRLGQGRKFRCHIINLLMIY